VEHAGACRSKIGIRRHKSKALRVRPGKIVQAQALLVQGRSQREIGRTLHISPMTVARIVKSEDFQSFITAQRERVSGSCRMRWNRSLACEQDCRSRGRPVQNDQGGSGESVDPVDRLRHCRAASGFRY
jgi:Homeodomain-like domain